MSRPYFQKITHTYIHLYSGNLNPVYSPDVDKNVLPILDTAQEGNNT